MFVTTGNHNYFKNMKIKNLLLISIILNLAFLVFFWNILYQKGGVDYIKWKLNLGEKPNQTYNSEYYKIKKSMFEVLPSSANEIIFLGNSLTALCNWNELLENPNIKNRGISTDVIEGVLVRIDEVIFSKPKQVFLMIGINDLIQNRSKEKILLDYEKLIKLISEKSPQTELFIQSILPTDNRTEAKNIDIIEINNALKELSKKYDKPYINLFDLLKTNENKLKPKFTIDGIHLNGEGYLVWKNAIKKYIY